MTKYVDEVASQKGAKDAENTDTEHRHFKGLVFALAVSPDQVLVDPIALGARNKVCVGGQLRLQRLLSISIRFVVVGAGTGAGAHQFKAKGTFTVVAAHADKTLSPVLGITAFLGKWYRNWNRNEHCCSRLALPNSTR
jgi:hypothetical protein